MDNNLPSTAQQIESFILEASPVLDDYYEMPVGSDRLNYRQLNPDADAKLFLLGRVTKLQSDTALRIASRLASEYGLGALLPEEPVTVTPRQYRPEGQGLGKFPWEK